MGKLQLIWTIDGHKFLNAGVHVERSNGILNRPPRRISVRHTWLEVSGEDVDVSKFVIESRVISLDCIITAATAVEALANFHTFMQRFEGSGFHQLTVLAYTAEASTALSWLVYREDEVHVPKRIKQGKNFWKFTLRLREAFPHKRLHLATGGAGTLTANLNVENTVYVGFDGGGPVVKVTPDEDPQAVSRMFTANGVLFRCLAVFYQDPDDVTINSMSGTHICDF